MTSPAGVETTGEPPLPVLEACRYLASAPVATAVIRRTHGDFRVSEILKEDPSGAGEHAFIHIEKDGANSHWVAERLASYCGIAAADVGYAGRKDRHAVTRQWFSCYLPGRHVEFDDLAIEGATLLRVSRHERKLRRGELHGNQFVLWLRDVAPGYRMGEVEDALQRIARNGFPNYFGEQRFGRDGANLVRAEALLNGRARQFRGQDMLVSAARAYLFNWNLSRCIEAGEIPVMGPMYGRSRDPQPGELDMPKRLQAWIEGLRRLRVKSGERGMLVKPDAMSWRFDGGDLCLSFTLPAGSFATALLREAVNATEHTGGEEPR